MCGIAGIHFKRPGSMNGPALERLVDNMLRGIEHRGGDATGFVAVSPGGERVVAAKEAMTASDFVKIRPSLGDGPIRTVLLHTRFATQGHQSNNVNNHPVLHGTTFVTHNGHIGNDDALFKEAEIDRLGEVDSEVIAALINKEGLPNATAALTQLQGGFAIAAIAPITYPDQLVLAKGNSSPLIFFENDNFVVWASELDVIKEAWGDSFGTPPRDRKFRQFGAGDLLRFNGAERTQESFTVLQYSRPNYYSGSSWSSNTLTQKEKDEQCFCGHTRFWHGSSDYMGTCQTTRNGGCPCEDFVSAVYMDEGGAAASMRCDGCRTWTPLDELTSLAANYELCDDCHSEYGYAFSDDKDDDKGDTSCPTDIKIYRDGKLVEANISQELASYRTPVVPVVTQPPGTQAERLAWLPISEGDDLLRHNYVLAKASERVGVNVQFMEWILFRSEIDVIDLDSYLKDAHEACDTAYADVEKELVEIEQELSADERRKLVLQ